MSNPNDMLYNIQITDFCSAEHVTAVTVSVRNKLDLALAVAVGSSIQIALFVLPFLVILGWCIGQVCVASHFWSLVLDLTPFNSRSV